MKTFEKKLEYSSRTYLTNPFQEQSTGEEQGDTSENPTGYVQNQGQHVSC